MRKNTASQYVSVMMLSAADATVLSTLVTGYVTGDGGTQTLGAGTLTYKARGEWSYAPTQAETNYNHIAFTFVHPSGINQLVNVYTLDYTYQAKVGLIDDNNSTDDIYTVTWFKDGVPITGGITSPTIQVFKVSDGTDLIASSAMTQVASTGVYKYVEGTNLIVDGDHYIVKVTATIDGATRTWEQWVGRDSA